MRTEPATGSTEKLQEGFGATYRRCSPGIDATPQSPMTTGSPLAHPPELVTIDQLFAASGARLLRAAWRMTRNRQDAEDLLQDAFSRACGKPDVFVGRSGGEAERWLWVVMRRAWRDRLARLGADTMSLPPEDLDQVLAATPSPLDEHEKGWALAVAYEGLMRLGPKHRLAMVLLARGLSETEAAEFAGVNRRTMREWRRDARRALGVFGGRLQAGDVCASLETSLSAYADGEHGPGKRLVALEAHLTHCRHCRAAVAEIRRHAAALSHALPVVGFTASATGGGVADAVDLVEISEQTTEAVGAPRAVAGLAPGLLGYIEDHWRLAVAAAAMPVLAAAMAFQLLSPTAGPQVPPAQVVHQATPMRTADPRPPAGQPSLQGPPSSSLPRPQLTPADITRAVPPVPAVRWAQVARAARRVPAASPIPGRATRRTAPVVSVRPDAPAPVGHPTPPRAEPRPCTTASCLFAP